MQKERDDIDEFILESFSEIEPNENYNYKLIDKLHGQKVKKDGKSIPLAVSFILSGILVMLLYTTDLQFKIIDLKFKVVSQIMSVQYNYKLDLGKYIIGE